MSSLQTKALCLIESTYHAHKLHQPHPSATCELAAQRRNHWVETAMTGARVLLWKALANSALLKVIQKDRSFFLQIHWGCSCAHHYYRRIPCTQFHSRSLFPRLHLGQYSNPESKTPGGSGSSSGQHGQQVGNPSYASSLKLILMLFSELDTW